ncbi:TonB family protein [Pontibacter sp. Tf4]|uniref:M56 family metallopeptidase n=1 Tax=Pontibacter sp. Tf4 TaxID=2761620 RepID=UPI001629C5E6|nr:M56 family metallopeptidase [Pontibacter sp. Tf4]MBB6611162.1 TonB family protein [Pontibacter sp. Tf4]
METIYNYILQSGLCLLLLYGFYLLVLRSFPRVGFNRLFLLLAPVLAGVLPLLELPLPVARQYLGATGLPDFRMAEVLITTTAPGQAIAADNSISLEHILAIVYAAAALVLLIRLGVQLYKLRGIIRSATPLPNYSSEATVLQTQSNYPTFAFLNYIFLHPQGHLSSQEQQQVLAHELAHVRLGHSYDVLYYELLTAVLWFNPLVWLLKAELRDVHEYQADAAVVSVYQPEAYSSLLAKEALYKTGMPVGSYFYRPQVFKRLHMLRKHNQKTTLLRPLLAIPMLLLLLFFFSTKDVTADMVQALAQPVTKATIAQQPITPAPATIAAPEITAPEEPTITTQPETKPLSAEPEPEKKPEVKEPEAVSQPEAANQPFMYVEQMPVFEGGEVELQKYIAKNLRYPETTREAGKTGLVVATFIVEPDGQLSDIGILKGLDEAADTEVKRILETMSGKWLPGRQNGKAVQVRYTLPVRFSLTK